MNDIPFGEKVFKSFWKWSKTFYGNSFSYSYDEFLKLYGNKANIYLDGVGLAVRSSKISDSGIDTSMRSLALSSGGKVPKDWNDYINAMNGEATKINWLDATKFVAVESAKDIIKGAETVGNSVIFTGKMLTYLLPLGVLIFAFFFLNSKTNNQLLKALKK